jgi:hypothetical protein
MFSRYEVVIVLNCAVKCVVLKESGFDVFRAARKHRRQPMEGALGRRNMSRKAWYPAG